MGIVACVSACDVACMMCCNNAFRNRRSTLASLRPAWCVLLVLDRSRRGTETAQSRSCANRGTSKHACSARAYEGRLVRCVCACLRREPFISLPTRDQRMMLPATDCRFMNERFCAGSSLPRLNGGARFAQPTEEETETVGAFGAASNVGNIRLNQ